jgi:uncharacterized iron-regulated protein
MHWHGERLRDHRLVGRILDVRAGRWVEEAVLDAALASAQVVVLGETHDNPDHHILQARELRAVASGGRAPAVAFEMLDVSLQPRVDEALAGPAPTAEGVARAVAWETSSWPDFELYRPIVEAALGARLPLVAANLSRAVAREAAMEGVGALPDDVRAALERAPPPTPEELAAWREEMKESHCGELPEGMLEPLVLAQRARDAQMALRVAAAAAGRGAVLITGGEHARLDRGVPAWLAREAPGLAVLSVAHLEVDAGGKVPEDYAAQFGGSLPYHFVVFTPATEREDPCEGMRRHMERKKRKAPAPTAPPATP